MANIFPCHSIYKLETRRHHIIWVIWAPDSDITYSLGRGAVSTNGFPNKFFSKPLWTSPDPDVTLIGTVVWYGKKNVPNSGA